MCYKVKYIRTLLKICIVLEVPSIAEGLCGVIHDGTLLESWPVQMHHVYAITLQKPADRSIENQP